MKAGDHFEVKRGFYTYAPNDSKFVASGTRGVCIRQHELAPRQCFVEFDCLPFRYWIRDSLVRVLSPLELLAECGE